MVKAQDIIHRGDYDPCDYSGVYLLYKQAFGNEALARKAQSQAAENHMNRETSKHGRK